MRSTFLAAVCTAALVAAVNVALVAQTPPAPPAQTTAQPTASMDQPVTIVGCVQKESDYRSARDKGKGGAVGTGIGTGNEFVLVDATPAASAAKATPGAAAGTPTGTAGTLPAAYELTGKNESQVEQYLGKRVEISGKLKAAAMGATGPTGGATAGAPPTGVDVVSKDLKLRELEVTSVRETAGTCPAMP